MAWAGLRCCGNHDLVFGVWVIVLLLNTFLILLLSRGLSSCGLLVAVWCLKLAGTTAAWAGSRHHRGTLMAAPRLLGCWAVEPQPGSARAQGSDLSPSAVILLPS